jgi:hypothetical protein
MHAKSEVLAVLLAEDAYAEHHATMLVRDANGQMSLQTVNPDSTVARLAMRTGCFRRGKPIFDPVSREMIGYEMEEVANQLSSIA